MLGDEVYLEKDQCHILCDAKFPFKQAYLNPHELSVTGYSEEGRCPAFFFNIKGKEYLLKHYYRGGLPARWSRERYLYTGRSRVRAWREWYLLRQLHQWNLPVPYPCAAAYRRVGLLYTADLIVASCRPARPLSSCLGEQPLEDKFWHLIGNTLRRFHDRDVCHADLNAHNILLLPEEEKVFLVDFDRGAIRRGSRWRQANLERLLHSLNELLSRRATFHYSDHNFHSLLSAYYAR